jgi:hypothetical protein
VGDLRRYDEAEALYKAAAELREKVLGTSHPETGLSVLNLGGYHLDRGQYEKAERLLLRARAILEAAYQPDHDGGLRGLAPVHRGR